MVESIETERLILRKFFSSDAEDMFRLDTDKMVHRYLGNTMNKSIDDAKKNINSIIQQYNDNGIGRWAAIEKSSGKFIGWSGLKLNNDIVINGHNDIYDIGYRLLPKFWGMGYATESSLASLDYGFNVLNLDTIYAITHIENEASHKVLLKLGLDFINTFELKDEEFLLRWYQLKSKDYGNRMS